MEYITIASLGDDGFYTAFHPEMPNVLSQGESMKMALAALEDATEMALLYLREGDLRIPTPILLSDALSVSSDGSVILFNGTFTNTKTG